MPNGREKQKSNVEIIHKHQFVKIQICLTSKIVGITAATLLAIDLLFIFLYLATTLPEDHILALFHSSKILDISLPSTLPGAYFSLKLLCGSAIAALAIWSFDARETVSKFWYLALIILSYLTINDMTQFESVWADHVAISFFGAHTGEQYGPLLSQGIPIAVFYAAAIIELHPQYKLGLYCLLTSSIPIAMGPLSPEISFAAHNLILETPFSSYIEAIDRGTFQMAWQHGLALVSSTLLITGVLTTLYGMQKKVVTYVWHDNEGSNRSPLT